MQGFAKIITTLSRILKKRESIKYLKSALYILNYAFASFPLAYSNLKPKIS